MFLLIEKAHEGGGNAIILLWRGRKVGRGRCWMWVGVAPKGVTAPFSSHSMAIHSWQMLGVL